MATIVNARDVELQATSPRVIVVELPSNQEIDFDRVRGSHKPSNNADVTQTSLISGVTVTGGGITLSAGGAIKGGQTAYATGTGFHFGYSSSLYRLSVGSSTKYFRWTGTAVDIIGDIGGDGSINITGTAKFNGQDGSTFSAVTANQNGVGVAQYGVTAYSAHSAGGAIVGISNHASGTGVVGVYGEALSLNGYGVWAFHNSASGTALKVNGKMSIDNTTKVTSLNADLLDGKDSAGFVNLDASSGAQVTWGVVANGSSTATDTGNTKPGSTSAYVWEKVVIGGTTYYRKLWPA